MHIKFLTNYNTANLDEVAQDTSYGKVECPICKQSFDLLKDMTKHILKDHNLTRSQLYQLYEVDYTTRQHICPICGKHYTMNDYKWKMFSNDNTYSICCSMPCSTTLRLAVQGSPFERLDVRESAKQTMLKH